MIDLVGRKCGRLTVIRELPKRGRNRYFLCTCDCGGKTETQYGGLTTGTSKSCGCLMREQSAITGRKNATHGMRDHRIYNVWNTIRSRCRNPNSKSYDSYGGKGIDICDEWFNSFQKFIGDMGIPPDGHEIDRIDNSKGYNKINCRWTDRVTQSRNKDRAIFINYKGKSIHICALAKLINMKPSTLRHRFRSGNFVGSSLWEEPIHAKPSARIKSPLLKK